MKNREKRISKFLQSLEIEEMGGNIQTAVVGVDLGSTAGDNMGTSCSNHTAQGCAKVVNAQICKNYAVCEGSTNLGTCHNLPTPPPRPVDPVD